MPRAPQERAESFCTLALCILAHSSDDVINLDEACNSFVKDHLTGMGCDTSPCSSEPSVKLVIVDRDQEHVQVLVGQMIDLQQNNTAPCFLQIFTSAAESVLSIDTSALYDQVHTVS